jgi:thiol-disulfide isomerase/thioredoxin
VSPSVNKNARPGPTPVPPRGAKRKPNRPTSKRPPAAGPSPARPGAGARPADNRRAALAQQRRRNQTLLGGGVIGLVIVIVAVFVIIKATGGGTKSDTTSTAVPASTLTSLNSAVTLQDMKAAATNFPLSAVSGEGSTYPQPTSDTPITTTGKPTLLYIGAQFCPYCAAERWPMVLALSKFGTFHNLSTIHSSATDVFPSTPTFSFYKSTYTSPYLTFTPVETETVTQKPLQSLTAAQTAIESKYDTSGDIPFIYFNGKAIINGAEYSPSLLGSGQNGPASKMTFQQIANDISGGTSKLASSVAADAGAIVSEICRMTGGKPASVCSLFPQPITS